MLYTLFYLSSFILLVDLVNSQQYVSLSAPSTIRFKTDKLQLTCTPQGATTSNSITSIALQKKNSIGQFTDVVKVFTFNNQNVTSWTDSTMQSVATISKQYVSPSSTAGLQIQVAANNVKCTFSGEYRCEIKSIKPNGIMLDGFSNAVNVNMTVSPVSINAIAIARSPSQPENIYNENTVVTLSCSGDVGNPASNLRWCIFRNGKDSGFIGYPNSADITQDTASFNQDGCQYRRTSRLTYNVSASYNYADFRCETGGTTTTCGHISAIAANITIKKFDLVNSQQYVSLSAPSTIRFKTDKLQLTCTPQGATTSNSITSIALQKKNSIGQFTDVVKVFTFNNQNVTSWTDSTMQSVATILKQYVSPSSTAGLQIQVAANNVKCTFSGEYRCEIKSIKPNGIILDGFSNAVNVIMTVSPVSINAIAIARSPSQPENIYNENTVVTLSCSGDVGNPASNLRWCIFRNGKDSGFIGYPNSADITQDTASFNQDGCQYRRTSRLTYNVSASYNYADFRCETGGTTTTCGHISAIAANITIKKYTEPNTGDQEDLGTSSAGAIAGGVIGAFVVIDLIIVIVYFLAFRKKNAGDSYRANGENEVYDNASNNRPDNHVYSTMNSSTEDNAQDDDSSYNL